MNEEQRFAFDTWGFLTVEDAITPEQVADLKATVDARGPELHSQHADRGGFWSQAFVDLLDVPVIAEILAEIYGGQRAGGLPPFRIDHINVHTHGTFNKDLAGGTIHGSNGRLLNPNRPHELVTHYFARDPATGTFSNGLVTVAYELEDTVCNGGGFGCLAARTRALSRPGSVGRFVQGRASNGHPRAGPRWHRHYLHRGPVSRHAAVDSAEHADHAFLQIHGARGDLFRPDNFFSPTDADQWQGINERKRAIRPPPQAFVERRAELAKREADGPKFTRINN